MEESTSTNGNGYTIHITRDESTCKKMINRKVRCQEFIPYEGWKFTGEGKIIAETDTAYKIKTGWFSSIWANKDKCEEITN